MTNDLPARRRFLCQCAAAALSTRVSWGQRGDEPDENAFRAMFSERAQQAVKKGLDYLVSQQIGDGSFGEGGYSRNVAICGLCGMALLASGSSPGRGPFGGELTALVDFLLEACQESGFISYRDAASRGPMYGHGFATLFLAEVHGMSLREELHEKLSRAVRLIVNTQNREGGWRYEPRRSEADLSVTVCQVMALRAARNAGIFVPNETIDRATSYVKSCQNEDGGFMYIAKEGGASEFPRSAAAIVALYSAGIYEGEEIERGLAYLMRHPPRANTFGRQNHFMYGHYYAIQAMWHAGDPKWEEWYPGIRDVLIQQQHADGSWFDVNSIEYGTAMACLILQMPRNYLPIFRR